MLTADTGGPDARVAGVLAKYMRAQHAAVVDVAVVDLFDEMIPGVGVLAKFAYQQTREFVPAVFGTMADVRAAAPDHPLATECERGLLERLVQMVRDQDAEVVIGVGALAGALAASVPAAGRPPVACVLPDHWPRDVWLHPGCNLYFVPCREARDELVVRGVGYGNVVVSGVPVDLTGPADRAQSRAENRLAERFTVALMPLTGGSDVVARIATDLSQAGIQVAAHPGQDARLARRLESLEKAGSVAVLAADAGRRALVAAADVVACRAGSHVLYEALALGRPCLIYNPVPGQEVRNTDFLANAGAVWIARDAEDLVEKARFLAAHSARLRRFAEDSASLSLPSAVQTVCERVLASV